MENHFTESVEATFFSSQLLSSFQRITLSEKLSGRAPAGFNRESTLGRALLYLMSRLQVSLDLVLQAKYR
jgi:hypothetical protein